MLGFKQLVFTLYFLLNLTSCSKDNSNQVAAVSNENSDTYRKVNDIECNARKELWKYLEWAWGNQIREKFLEIKPQNSSEILEENVENVDQNSNKDLSDPSSDWASSRNSIWRLLSCVPLHSFI